MASQVQLNDIRKLHEQDDYKMTGYNQSKGQYNISPNDPYELYHAVVAGGTLDAGPIIVTGLTVANPNVSVGEAGGTSQIVPTITYFDDIGTEALSYNAVGDADITVDAAGLITVAGTATEGDTSVITVTSDEDGEFTATVNVLVIA